MTQSRAAEALEAVKKAMNALAIEVPASVALDVAAKVDHLITVLEQENKAALQFYQRRGEIKSAAENVVWASENLEPIFDVDVPGMPHGDSIGWQGNKEIPVTFGQVRAFKEALATLNSILGEKG